MEFRMPQLSALRSYTVGLKFGYRQLQSARPALLGAFLCASRSPRQDLQMKKKGEHPKNVDLPPILPKKKKKSYPIPIQKTKQAGREDKNLAEMGIDMPLKKKREPPVKKKRVPPQNVDLPPILPKKQKKPYPIPLYKLKEAGREDKRLARMGIEKPLEPPKNGILVPDLIAVAYDVLNSWKRLIKGVAQLSHVVPVYGCSKCPELHVAQTGHDIKDCLGRTNAQRQSFHSWVKASVNDVLIPVESYHLYDPFGRRVYHETRFEYDRIPAVVELCIQAGVDIPEYPSRRRTNPVRMIGRRVIDRGGFVREPKPRHSVDSSSVVDLDTHGAGMRFPPPPLSEVPRIAQETMYAYERVSRGLTKLMGKYTVKVCGYCPEVHVGPWGHNAKLCGAYKHQWRDGKHGWQDATVDNVFPPNYVWHVQDPKGPPLRGELKRFYGKAPAVVELCMQAGASVPSKYERMMRRDIVIPDSEEARLVA